MRSFFLIAILLLYGCAGNVREVPHAVYDLGNFAPVWRPAEPTIAGVSVQAPSWLATPEISFRLLYAGDMRRNVYGESRWVAPPADLIERALNRQTPETGGGCRLQLDIDELIQVFDTPQSSRMLLDARATLLAPGSDAVLARKAFSVARPAPGPDARGGVAAAALAVQALGGELNAWLTEIVRAKPAVARQCRPD